MGNGCIPNRFLCTTHREMTASQVYHSEEAWYLRNMCQRNNARIINTIAESLDLKIPTQKDTHAFTDNHIMASVTSETVYNDMYLQNRDTEVVVTNNCARTTGVNVNGIMCRMNPSEGVCVSLSLTHTHKTTKTLILVCHCGLHFNTLSQRSGFSKALQPCRPR